MKIMLLGAALFYALVGNASHVNAANIYEIAKDFVKKIESAYVEKISISPIEQIPDGGTLLLKPRSQKLFYTDEIYALKKNGKIYLAFDDVINILEFSIDYNKETSTANGWFIREDWIFDADFNNQKVISKNVSYQVKPQDLYYDDGLLFVEGQTLGKWLDLSFEYDIKDQIVDIESPFPLPSIARNLRKSRNPQGDRFNQNQAQLPRLEQDKKDFDINTADVYLGTRYNKSQTGATNRRNSANVILEGEVLKHNSYLFASGDSENNLENVVMRFTKRSEEPTLLGALKARSYGVGDVDVVNLPLTGASGQDFGLRFSNNKLDNVDFASTDIEGDSIPDWDIELYRNDVLISSQVVDQNGRYRFEDIRLFVGNNDFELFFFGPQGEIRTEKISIPVNQELLASQDKTYEVSATFEDTQTLQKNSIGDEDRNAAHIAARYNKLLGQNSLGFLGFRTNEIAGDRKLFLTSGLSSTLGQTLLDTNFAVDESGEFAAEAIARRRIANWDISVNARANTDDYITGESLDPTILNLGFNAQKSFAPLGFRTNLLANGVFQKTVSGSELGNYGIGISNNISGANISNRLTYEKNNIIDGTDTERFDHVFSARKTFGKYFLRLGSTYEISPEERFRNINGQINYRHNSKFSADLTYDKQLVTELDTSRLNLNYTHDKFRLSPFFQYNSDDEIIAGLNLNFSLTDDPQSRYPDISNRRYVGRGALSALVYHDKDGNLIFDGDDEPLENAIVESVNYKRRAPTNADGYATIRDLTTTQATDIIVDVDSLPDPFMIPATKGKSIFPDAGSLYEMEFPVHLTGEVEGNVYIVDEEGEKTSASFQTMRLTSLNNPNAKEIAIKTERDGYYVISDIPAGDYILTIANKGDRYGNDIGKFVSIGYDGTIVKDVNFNISKNKSYVPYEISFDTALGGIPALRITTSGQSELSQTLSRLIQSKNDYDPYQGLIKLTTIESRQGEAYYSMTSPDLNAAHQKCQDIESNNVTCTIIIPGNAAAKKAPIS